MNSIRSLVYGLRPPALDDQGLSGAIRQLLSAGTAHTGIATELEAPAALPDLPAAVEVAAYRIVQEALTNVVRHASATRAAVLLRCCDGRLLVQIRDDGRGLPGKLVAGVGLTSMRERAEDVGGTMTFASPDGTVIEAVLPVDPT